MEATKRPCTAPVTHSGDLKLIDLPKETLHAIVARVYDADVFAVAHTHTSLWAIIREVRRHLKTPAVAVASVGRLAWVHSLPTAAQPDWMRRWDDETMDRLVAFGRVDCIAWAARHGLRMDEWTCCAAAEHNQLRVLQFLREQHCPWNDRTCAAAAKGGHSALLWWARRNGCEWDAFTCYMAAMSGNLLLLQELRRQGCPWDHETYQIAQWNTRGGCPDAAKLFAWVQEQDCPERHPLAAIFGSPSVVPYDWQE